MGLLDDCDSRSALSGEERQLADQMANRTRFGVRGRAYPNLSAGAFGREAMQVWVIAACHQAATPAGPTRPRTRIRVEAQQTRGQIEGERRLAGRARTHEQYGMRGAAEEHRTNLGQSPRLATSHRVADRRGHGPDSVGLSRQAGRLLAGRLTAATRLGGL
jgi:hypothetical protein